MHCICSKCGQAKRPPHAWLQGEGEQPGHRLQWFAVHVTAIDRAAAGRGSTASAVFLQQPDRHCWSQHHYSDCYSVSSQCCHHSCVTVVLPKHYHSIVLTLIPPYHYSKKGMQCVRLNMRYYRTGCTLCNSSSLAKVECTLQLAHSPPPPPFPPTHTHLLPPPSTLPLPSHW